MDVIKFRAWNTVEGKMYYDMGVVRPPFGIMMQFTGLYDKRGNEIYISDLVRVSDDELIAEVIINDFSKIPVLDNDVGQLELYKCHKSLEVVGNIYEGILE